MARSIGIDIGDHSIKIVELSGSAKSFKIQRVAIRPIPEKAEAPLVVGDEEPAAPPPTRDELIAAEVKAIFEEMALPREDVCASFHARNSMIRELPVPFFENDQIRKVVRFQAEDHLHSHSIDEVVINWIKTGETKDGSRLTIFASPKDKLAESIAILRRAGVDPATVDLDATALFTAIEGAKLLVAHPSCIVLHVGASSTNLILIVEGRPRVFRSFPLGTGALEAAVTHELGTSGGEGRRRVLHRGAAHEDPFATGASLAVPGEAGKSLAQLEAEAVADESTAFVNKLHREVIRSLAAVRTETPPARLLLTGGGALLAGMAEALEERFGLPVERLDFFDHLEAKDKGPDPAYAGAALGPAIGCALRMLGRNPLDIELLQDEFAPRNTFDVIRTSLATLLTLGFLALAVMTVATKRQLAAEQTHFEDKYAVAKSIYTKIETKYLQGVESMPEDAAGRRVAANLSAIAKDPKRLRELHRRLLRRHAHLQDQLGLSDRVPPLPSAFEAMTKLYEALQAADRVELGYVRIERMTIRTRSMSVTVHASAPATLDRIRTLLEASPYFQERSTNPRTLVQLGAMSREGEFQRQEFTIDFKESD